MHLDSLYGIHIFIIYSTLVIGRHSCYGTQGLHKRNALNLTILPIMRFGAYNLLLGMRKDMQHLSDGVLIVPTLIKVDFRILTGQLSKTGRDKNADPTSQDPRIMQIHVSED